MNYHDQNHADFTRLHLLQRASEKADRDDATRLKAEAITLRNQIFENNIRLIRTAILKVKGPHRWRDDDVNQIALLAALKAVEKFNPFRGFKFSSYLFQVIWSRVYMHVLHEARRSERFPACDEIRAFVTDPEIEDSSRLTELLDALDDDDRQFISDRYGLDGDDPMPYWELARERRRHPSGMAPREQRILARMRQVAVLNGVARRRAVMT
jgi:RNA polymerase sigma factor (sigma-70 family)